MKIRSIPYGYMYENGVVVINQEEAKILRQIFDMYLDGMSLQQIGHKLNSEHIEYQPDVMSWNKSRLMRIIDDKRYTGNCTYPAIIDTSLHQTLMEEKDSRNTQINTDRSTGIYTVTVPVICPVCGAQMHRRNDSRCKCPQRWVCKNAECRELIPYADEEMFASITTILNRLICNPEEIIVPEAKDEVSTDIVQMESDIKRALNTMTFDRDSLRQTMLRCAAQKFTELDQTAHLSMKLKADFGRVMPLTEFSADLFTRTIESIHLNANGTICLKLINGQLIAKE